MYIPKEVERNIKMMVNHPYASLRLLPMVGDFTDTARVANKSLYNNDMITLTQYHINIKLIRRIEMSGNPNLVREVVKMFKKHLEG